MKGHSCTRGQGEFSKQVIVQLFHVRQDELATFLLKLDFSVPLCKKYKFLSVSKLKFLAMRRPTADFRFSIMKRSAWWRRP